VHRSPAPRAVAPLLLAVVAACATPDPAAPTSPPSLAFTPAAGIPGLTAPVDSLIVTRAGSRLVLDGVADLPDPCHALTAEVAERGDTLVVTVEGRQPPGSGGCTTNQVRRRYRAEVRPGGRRGVITLRVAHAIVDLAGVRWRTRDVLRQQITLP
jgi:hypothetical protein